MLVITELRYNNLRVFPPPTVMNDVYEGDHCQELTLLLIPRVLVSVLLLRRDAITTSTLIKENI